jgi:hypothetical protein
MDNANESEYERELDSDDTDEPVESPVGLWAHRHPWLLAFLTGLTVFALVGIINGLTVSPLPLGRSATFGDFTYNAHSAECRAVSESNNQVCTIKLTIRNNENQEGRPWADYELVQGNRKYTESGRRPSIFPHDASNSEVSFTTPRGREPTAFLIRPDFPFRLVDKIPFVELSIRYDIADP